MFEDIRIDENLLLLVLMIVVIFLICKPKRATKPEQFCVLGVGDDCLKPGYISCGNDGSVCDYDGYNDIYYGIPNQKLTKVQASQMPQLPNKKFTCLPAGFGSVGGNPVLPIPDPVPGQRKQCYISPALKTAPPGFVTCGNDGAVCDYSNGDVYYGKAGVNIAKVPVSQMPVLPNKKFTCLPAGFGPVNGNPVLPIPDPVPGQGKQCYIMYAPKPAPTPAPMPVPTQPAITSLPLSYTACGNDGADCEFDAANDIYYGVANKSLLKIAKDRMTSGKFTCLPLGFKSPRGFPILPVEDPLPGTQKTCYLMPGEVNREENHEENHEENRNHFKHSSNHQHEENE